MINSRARSIALLKKVVKPKEFKEYDHFGRITVKVKYGTYVIRSTSLTFSPAKRPDEDIKLCIVWKQDWLPPRDTVLMKYLLIKGDPQRLWATAKWNLVYPVRQLNLPFPIPAY